MFKNNGWRPCDDQPFIKINDIENFLWIKITLIFWGLMLVSRIERAHVNHREYCILFNSIANYFSCCCGSDHITDVWRGKSFQISLCETVFQIKQSELWFWDFDETRAAWGGFFIVVWIFLLCDIHYLFRRVYCKHRHFNLTFAEIIARWWSDKKFLNYLQKNLARWKLIRCICRFSKKYRTLYINLRNSRKLHLDQGWPLRGPQHLFMEKINHLFLKILREFAR